MGTAQSSGKKLVHFIIGERAPLRFALKHPHADPKATGLYNNCYNWIGPKDLWNTETSSPKDAYFPEANVQSHSWLKCKE